MITRRRLLSASAVAAGAAAGGLWTWQRRALGSVVPTENVASLRSHGRRVRVQNVDLHVIDAGQGPPVVFIHGIPDTTDLWADSIEALHPSRRCIAFDLPDFGRSATAEGRFDWSADNRAPFVADVLDALGIEEPVRIVAHNAGGTFGAIFAAAHPERVDRALFSVTTIHPDHGWHLPARINRTPGLGELAMAAYSWPRFQRTLATFSGPGFSEERMRETFERIDGRMKRAILSFYRSTDKAVYREWQPRFEQAMARKPLRVIWGELNPGASVELARRSFPTDDVIVYEQTGHWPMLELEARWRRDLLAFI
ncbi:MAG: alpha/beta hydrolase [Myxococcota bacterium]|nr:alpha/beta hydrolase [Myxococcota bacterium]